MFRDFEGALNRLNAMIRGIGDPMVSIYARAYICRVCRLSYKSHAPFIFFLISFSILDYGSSSVLNVATAIKQYFRMI